MKSTQAKERWESAYVRSHRSYDPSSKNSHISSTLLWLIHPIFRFRGAEGIQSFDSEVRRVVLGSDLAAAMADQFADSANNVVIEEVNKGLNPGMIVLLVVAIFLLLFFVGNYALYVYAQKTLPPRKKKPVSKKKMKREKLKQGVSAPGE